MSPPRGGGGGRIFSTAKSVGPRLTHPPDDLLAVKEENNLKLPIPSPLQFPQPVRSLSAPRKEKIKMKKQKTKKQNFGDVWWVLPAVPARPRCRRELLALRIRGSRCPSPALVSGCWPACPGGEAGKSPLPGSRLFRVSSLSAEAAGLGRPRGARPLHGGLTKRGASGALPAGASKAISAGATQSPRVRAPSAGPRGPGSPGSSPSSYCLTWGCCCSSRRRSGRRRPWSPGPG